MSSDPRLKADRLVSVAYDEEERGSAPTAAVSAAPRHTDRPSREQM